MAYRRVGDGVEQLFKGQQALLPQQLDLPPLRLSVIPLLLLFHIKGLLIILFLTRWLKVMVWQKGGRVKGLLTTNAGTWVFVVLCDVKANDRNVFH